MRFGRRGPSLGAVLLLVLLVAALVSGGEEGGDEPRPPRAERDQRAGGGRDEGGGGGDGRGANRDDDRSTDRSPAPGASARVLRTVDGDTIEVALGGEVEDVRYIGIDTPESVAPGQPVECFGKRASEANERLVAGELVRLVFDRERRDRYGRLLAYVYRGGLFVNAELVRRGLARTLEIAPNTARAPLLDRLELKAGRQGRGLWGACEP